MSVLNSVYPYLPRVSKVESGSNIKNKTPHIFAISLFSTSISQIRLEKKSIYFIMNTHRSVKRSNVSIIMKKEIFFAILIGLFFGLVVTYGIYRANQADTQEQVATILESTELASNQQNGIEVLTNLVVSNPKNESIVTEQTQTIAGTTSENAFVVIYINETPYITTADETGAFSISADLRLGANIIGIHSLDNIGQETTTEIIVSYTTQPLLPRVESDSDTENTDDNQDENENNDDNTTD